MPGRYIPAAASVLFLGMTSLNSYAGSMYCGTTLISDGGNNPPSMTEVMAKCGAPIEQRKSSNELVYKDHKKLVTMRFDTNGKLQSLIYGGSAGLSSQDQKLEKIDQSIQSGVTPVKPAGDRATDASTVTKGRDVDPSTISKGRDADPSTITKGTDAK